MPDVDVQDVVAFVYFECTFLDHLHFERYCDTEYPQYLPIIIHILDYEREMTSQLSVNAFNYRLTMTSILIASVIALLFVSSSVSAEMGYVGDDVVEIQRVSQGKFRYPRSAARREIEGEVTIEFNVGITGEVVDAFVVEATPPNRFEKNALKYVRSWVYEPLRLNGVPTEVQRIETKVIYRLQN